MIDLHTHVLPGIDDGPPEVGESLELLRIAEGDGSEIVAATPHVRADFPAVRLSEIASRCLALNRALPEDRDVKVVAGAEVDLSWAQGASAEELALASYRQRGTDVLLETPYGSLPSGFEELLFRISARGFRVLLAHPERNPTFQEDRRRLAALVDRGVLLQVTAGSLASGDKRSRVRRLAHALVEEGLAHVIASDAHSPKLARAPLSAGVAAAARLAPRRARWMVTEVPAAILAGDPIPPAPVERRPARRVLSRSGPYR